MSISDIFWIVVDFLSLRHPSKKVQDKENEILAKQSFAASEEGKQINQLKEALDEVKLLRQDPKPEPADADNPFSPPENP